MKLTKRHIGKSVRIQADRKQGSRWWFDSFCGVGGCPSPFKTKREATARVELYYGLLRDRVAGRL